MKRILFGAAVFILGVLTGASFTSVLIGYRIDTLYMENRNLQDNLLAADRQIEQLQESQKAKKRVISNIRTHVEFDEKNDYTDFEKNTIELNVEKKVREWLEIISGQNVDDVNYLLIPQIIDNREIEAENRKIRLKVDLVVISETVSVYIKIIPLKSKQANIKAPTPACGPAGACLCYINIIIPVYDRLPG